MILKTTTNTGKSKQKFSQIFQKKESKPNNLSSENFISDPLAVFSKPMGTINFRILGKFFKRNQITKKIPHFFFELMKTRVIEVLKLIVIR